MKRENVEEMIKLVAENTALKVRLIMLDDYLGNTEFVRTETVRKILGIKIPEVENED